MSGHDLEQRIEELERTKADLEKSLAKAIRVAGDRLYMMHAYRFMLGPKGEQVAAMWEAKNVTRQHTSWGPGAAALSGEERAQAHLDVEAAPSLTVGLDEIFGPKSGPPRSISEFIAALTPAEDDKAQSGMGG